MTSVVQLTETGRALGFEGEALAKFVTEQQAQERADRALERELEKQRLEQQALEHELEKQRIEKQALDREQQEKDFPSAMLPLVVIELVIALLLLSYV